jgi:hypothetical protein
MGPYIMANVGPPTKEVAAARLAELRPIMVELSYLSDDAVVRELNARGVLSLKGAKWSHEIQITRLRKRLGLVRQSRASRKLTEHVYRQILKNLSIHFGPQSRTADKRLVECAAQTATEVYRVEQVFNLASDLSQITAEVFREYRRQRVLLGRLLDCLRVASDVFERLPRAPKSRATLIFEDVEILVKVEGAIAPKMATTDRASRL